MKSSLLLSLLHWRVCRLVESGALQLWHLVSHQVSPFLLLFFFLSRQSRDSWAPRRPLRGTVRNPICSTGIFYGPTYTFYTKTFTCNLSSFQLFRSVKLPIYDWGIASSQLSWQRLAANGIYSFIRVKKGDESGTLSSQGCYWVIRAPSASLQCTAQYTLLQPTLW